MTSDGSFLFIDFVLRVIYEPGVGKCRRIYGTCIKCGQSVIGYNDKALTLEEGVEMEYSVVFPDLEELDLYHGGHDFELTDEDYEKSYEEAVKQFNKFGS